MMLSSRRGSLLACAVSLLATTAACTEVDVFGDGRKSDSRDESARQRQQQFAAAAQEFGVPESVLLAVSYLESRWEAHAGQPSRAAGYGPMHLTDASWLGIDSHHSHGEEDPRGDDARPAPLSRRGELEVSAMAPALHTIDLAAELTGVDAATLRTDPGENIRGGAALLARYQRELTGAAGVDPAGWYGAVARYTGATDAATAKAFADDVYALIASGMARTTSDGQSMALRAEPEVQPIKSQLEGLGLSMLSLKSQVEAECPEGLGCEWIPAPYQGLNGGGYGNHDLASRPNDQKIRYIIIHDTEADYELTLNLVQNPAYVSWHYSLRSSDGHIAQHVKTDDVAWHAGNWYMNAKSIGLEHEGFAAKGTWYTEAMYRTSARLVRYLADRFDIPLDRAHILGHDNIPGITPAKVGTMHWDPGPYWDWDHYFELLLAPFQATGDANSGLVTIKPDFASNQPGFIGCDTTKPADPCPAQGSTSVILYNAPSKHAPLLQDIGLHPDGSPSTMRIWDIGSRVDTGQQYAVADRSGDWTAIWYLGQKGWFYDPPSARSAVWASGWVVTPKPGKKAIPVFGRAYPEAAAYPATVPVQAIVPLQYQVLAGQRYAVGFSPEAEYYRAVTLDATKHVVVSGQLQYYQIQFGHRVMYVMADDVLLLPSWEAAP